MFYSLNLYMEIGELIIRGSNRVIGDLCHIAMYWTGAKRGEGLKSQVLWSWSFRVLACINMFRLIGQIPDLLMAV